MTHHNCDHCHTVFLYGVNSSFNLFFLKFFFAIWNTIDSARTSSCEIFLNQLLRYGTQHPVKVGKKYTDLYIVYVCAAAAVAYGDVNRELGRIIPYCYMEFHLNHIIPKLALIFLWTSCFSAWKTNTWKFFISTWDIDFGIESQCESKNVHRNSF